MGSFPLNRILCQFSLGLEPLYSLASPVATESTVTFDMPVLLLVHGMSED